MKRWMKRGEGTGRRRTLLYLVGVAILFVSGKGSSNPKAVGHYAILHEDGWSQVYLTAPELHPQKNALPFAL